MVSPVIDFLLTRKSAPISELREPAPGDDELKTILTVASRVPDHGRLHPWRFLVIEGESRQRLGELLVAGLRRRKPDASHEEIDKMRDAPLFRSKSRCT